MNLNKNLKNVVSLFSVEFISRFLAFLAVTYLARVLGAANFGIINIGLAVLSYAMIVANGGLTLLGTKKIASGEGNSAKLTGDILLTRILFSFILFIVSFFLIQILITSAESRAVITAYLFFLFPSSILLEWFFHGHQSMDIISIGRVAGSLSYLLFLYFFVTSFDDTVLTAVGWLIGGVINSVFLIIVFLNKKYRVKFNFKGFNFLKLLKESVPLGIASVIAQFVVLFPVIYLGFAATASDAGVFSAAYKLIVLLLVLDRVFNALFFPKIIQYYKVSPEKLSEIFNSLLKIIVMIAVSAGIMALVFSDFLILFVFGTEYNSAVLIFRILIGAFILTLINSVFTYSLIAIHKERIYTIALTAGAVVFLISLPLAFNYLGTAGTAVSLILFELVSLLVMFISLNKNIIIRFAGTVVMPIVVLGLVISPLIFLTEANYIIKSLIGLAGIFLVSVVLRFGRNELLFIKKVFI